MINPRWTPDKLDQLRELVADPKKLSAAQIGDLLHVKRNAVIGACHRNKIKLRGGKGGRHAGPQDQSWRPKPEADMTFSEPVPRNVPMDELGPRECRYPEGDGPFLFCGNPQQSDSSYCPGHHRLCWQRPREITDDERARRSQWGRSIARKGPMNTIFKGAAA